MVTDCAGFHPTVSDLERAASVIAVSLPSM
jgi:hypothetical protein